MTDFNGLNDHGVITGIAGDADTHRRLVDMGLIGAEYKITARRKNAALIDFGEFAAVVSAATLGILKTVKIQK